MLEVKFDEIFKCWLIERRELLTNPDGHVLMFISKEKAEEVALRRREEEF